ncbi:MAG: V-type ATP synthase subunit I [Candidatus Aenigmarchaeota archaeon]|nr:V-type ATP synthase subunit I [Candidatus Aenigmarchaeota archaeon]
MFHPEKMSRVTIAAPKAYMEKVIGILYDLNALHIEDYTDKELPAGSPLGDAEKASELLLDLSAIKSVIGRWLPKKGPATNDISLEEAERIIKKIREEVSRLYERKKTLEEEEADLGKEEKTLRFLKEAGISSFDQLSGYVTLEMAAGHLKKPVKLKEAIVFSPNTERSPAVIFYRKGDEHTKKSVLESLIEERIETGGDRDVSVSLHNALERKKEIMRETQEIDERLKQLAASSGQLPVIEAILNERLKKSEAPLRFAVSNNAFVIQGWVPQKNVAKLEEKIKSLTKEAYIHSEEDDEAPTKLENPKAAKPFEFFLNLYSLPRYDEIDPTWFIFLSFPIFYGFMLGDIGYGLVILALSLALRPKFKEIRALIDISIISAISTMIFGFIFGEFFGSEEIFGYHLTPYLHRIEHVNDLILASAVLGLIHINAGFILGFINEKHHHGWLKAILAKGSWLLLETGAALAALSALGYVNLDMTVPIGIMFVSILMILKGEGIAGVFEVPALLANVLSYARLAAIGLASASLAIVVNEMSEPLFHGGLLMAILGVTVLVIGHAINMAIGIMDAFLQSMRLHYVEAFGKFYKGSGKAYRPFGRDNAEDK